VNDIYRISRVPQLSFGSLNILRCSVLENPRYIAENIEIKHTVGMEFGRLLDLRNLLDRKSHFLFGPRATGKSWLITHTLTGAGTCVIDLLDDDTFSRLVRRPALLEEIIPSGARTAVIDEVQKLPTLLDQVHRMMERRGLRFLLTGSSARKLRRGTANLLGGRAWEAQLFPLTSAELGTEFNLLKYLNRGGLPHVYGAESPQDELRNYIKLYLREEIQAEAIVRRLDHFVRFLDVAALQSGEELNYEGIASDAGVPARTVAGFFEVLTDTLVGFPVLAYTQSKRRKAIKRSKFYLFDVGVAGAMAKRGEIQEGSELFGKALEHFLIQEVRAYLSYKKLDLPLCYWRTTTQQEVDLLIGEEIAIEIKATHQIGERHLSGLRALQEERQVKRFSVVSCDPLVRRSHSIDLLPWRQFLTDLWADRLF